MKVLHIIPSLAPGYGGPRQMVLEFCQQSQDQAWQSEICATDADGSGHLSVELNKPVLHEGIVTHFFRCQASASLNYSRPMRRWLENNVERYDVLHLNGIFCHATYAAAITSVRRGVPYVVSTHGMLEPWSMAQKRPKKVVAWHLFFRQVLENASAVVYTTSQERELTERSLGLRRGVVLPIGVSAKLLLVDRGTQFRKRCGFDESAPFLLTLSRIHPKKGIDILLREFAELKSAGQLAAWHLVIAGDGDVKYVKKLREFVRRVGIEPFVHWVGWLNGEQKYQAIAEASLFVLTSFQENFAIAVVEAMACGTPVLVSRPVGLAPHILEHGTGWVVDLDSQNVRSGLLVATSNSAELQARGAAGRALVREQFAWPKIVAQAVCLYEKTSKATQPRIRTEQHALRHT